MNETVRKVQKWVTTATNAIDSEDAKLVEQVSLHEYIDAVVNCFTDTKVMHQQGFHMSFRQWFLILEIKQEINRLCQTSLYHPT